jgi:hypothetical protein
MPFVGRVTNSVNCFLQQLNKQVAENFFFIAASEAITFATIED